MAATAEAPLSIDAAELKDNRSLILNISDIEQAAIEKWPKPTREFFNSGSHEQFTLKQNLKVFEKYLLRPRMLHDVSNPDTTTTVFGRTISFPLCVSPTAAQRLAHPDGEVATSKACATAGISMSLSSVTNSTIEEVVSAAEGKIDHTLQIYLGRNREGLKRIIRQAETAGIKALLLTIDSPIVGTRWNEARNQFEFPETVKFPIIESLTLESDQNTGNLANSANHHLDDKITWENTIPFLRSLTNMKLYLKGIITAEDALLAVEHGADGIIVSNHGGRQLDGLPATLDALPEIAEAVAGRIPVFIDGGFRKGSDIFKALALGADCCFIGRPVLWGLAYNGQEGVETTLRILKKEFTSTMQLTGCKSLKDIKRSHLGIINSRGFLERL